MTPEAVNEIAGIVVTLTAIPAVLTALIYGFGSPWWTSWLGRIIFAKWLAIALVFILIVARRTFGEYPGYEWVALIIYTFTFLTFSATTVEVIIERRGPDDGSVIPNPKEKFMTTTTLAVPDIWYKAQRVLRTVVQFLIVAVPIANGVAAAVIEYLRVQEDVIIPGWVFIWLNAILAGSALIIGLVARIMAVPGVNEWLMKIGLGSVPQSAIIPVKNETGDAIGIVQKDPKAVG